MKKLTLIALIALMAVVVTVAVGTTIASQSDIAVDTAPTDQLMDQALDTTPATITSDQAVTADDYFTTNAGIEYASYPHQFDAMGGACDGAKTSMCCQETCETGARCAVGFPQVAVADDYYDDYLEIGIVGTALAA